MNKVKRKNDSIEIIRGGGCLALFGIPMCLLGLAVFLSTFSAYHQDVHGNLVDTVISAGYASLIMLIGFSLIFGRSVRVVDYRSSSIIHYFRLGFKIRLSTLSSQSIEKLVLSEDDDDSGTKNYHIKVKTKTKTIPVFSHSNASETCQLAQDISRYTSAKLDQSVDILNLDKLTADLKNDTADSKSGLGRLTKMMSGAGVLAVMVFITVTMDNWSWNKLQDYSNQKVYVEFPDPLFVYDKPGLYELPLLFYDYKPTFLGNHQRHYLSLDSHQYEVNLQTLDDAASTSVTFADKQLNILAPGNFLIKLKLNPMSESGIGLKTELSGNATQTLFLQHGVASDDWVRVVNAEVPEVLSQKSGLFRQYFAGSFSPSLAVLNSSFYLNASFSYDTRGKSGANYREQYVRIPFGQDEKITWKSPPQSLINSHLISHENLIYSFGGIVSEAGVDAKNWVYHPDQDQWVQLAAIPQFRLSTDDLRMRVSALYVVENKLFVLVYGREYKLYQFDLSAEQPWSLIKIFSLPVNFRFWQFFDERTLISVSSRISKPTLSQPNISRGYIQLLDLNEYTVKTLIATPELNYGSRGNLLSPVTSSLKVYRYNDKTYLSHFEAFFIGVE